MSVPALREVSGQEIIAMRPTSQHVPVLMLTLAALATLAGCGRSGSEAPAPGSAPAPASAPAASATPAPAPEPTTLVRRVDAVGAADWLRTHPDTVVLTVAADLPFAMKRFCGSEGLENVVALSLMRDRSFAEAYGVLITDGPLAGITARAIVVLSAEDTVKYTELVPEIAQEPDYETALRAL